MSAHFPNNGRLSHYDVTWLYDDLLDDDAVEQDQSNEVALVQPYGVQPEQTAGYDQGKLASYEILNVLYSKIYQEITFI